MPVTVVPEALSLVKEEQVFAKGIKGKLWTTGLPTLLGGNQTGTPTTLAASPVEVMPVTVLLGAFGLVKEKQIFAKGTKGKPWTTGLPTLLGGSQTCTPGVLAASTAVAVAVTVVLGALGSVGG